MHEPWNALEAPRFTGPRTYARLPWVKELDGVDAAVYGLPWDGGTSFRTGTRFGPEAIRSASGMIRTYNPVQRVQVFGALSTIDFGDAPTAPGYFEESLKRMERFVTPIAEAGVIGIGMGGDHSVTLAELRALAEVHGRLGLVQLDAHIDLHDTYNELAPLARHDVSAGNRGGRPRPCPRDPGGDPGVVVFREGRETSPPTSESRRSRGSSWHS